MYNLWNEAKNIRVLGQDATYYLALELGKGVCSMEIGREAECSIASGVQDVARCQDALLSGYCLAASGYAPGLRAMTMGAMFFARPGGLFSAQT